MHGVDWKPLDGRVYPRFSGIRTFFRLPLLTKETISQADVALLGVPFDGGVSFRPGARFAPEHIRSMSTLGRGYHPDHAVHIFEELRVGDYGDVPIVPQDIQKTHDNIHKEVSDLLKQNVIPILVGGDHSIPLGSLQAVVEQVGPVGILHLDAHTDAYPPAWGCNVHHGTFMRLGHERGWFVKDQVVQVGIRAPFAAFSDVKTPHEFGFSVWTVRDIKEQGIEALKNRIRLMNCPVYVTVDVDCLDPAFAPGTGTPVPGGLTSYEVLEILKALSDVHVVGADVVEVCPPYDHAEITSLVAVSVLFEILSAIASFKRYSERRVTS